MELVYCPKCGEILGWHLAYASGNPFVYFTCSCGYDSREYFKYSVTSFTPMISADTKIDWLRHTTTTNADIPNFVQLNQSIYKESK